MSMTETELGTALLPFDPKALATLEDRAEEFRTAIAEARPFERAFLVGQAMKELREMITKEMLESIKAGEGQALGFKTDIWKDGRKYEDDVIRDITIEATLRGFYMVGNEVNIIAGGFYAAKNGMRRRVKEWPGLTGLQVAFSTPELKGGKAFVAVRAVYQLEGEECRHERLLKHLKDGEFDNRISIRVNSGQGDDAILGKAERKFYADLLEKLSGHPVDNADVDELVIDADSKPAATRSTLFDDEVGPPAGPDPSGQVEFIAEYEAKLAECEQKSQVGPIAKQAGGDERLTTEGRKAVMGLCTKRRGEL